MSVALTRRMAQVSLMVVLSGCSGTGLGSGLGLSPGAPAAPSAQSAAQPAIGPAVVQGFCPQIAMREDSAFHRVYAKGKTEDSDQIIYQASLADYTRSCTRTETTISVTALVQGRLVPGPQGKAGTLNLPLRVTVIDGETQVMSELEQYPVTLADVNQPLQFIYTKLVTIPASVSSQARVYIGFDQGKKKK